MTTEDLEHSGSRRNNYDRGDVSEESFTGECCPHSSNCTATSRGTYNQQVLTADVDHWAAFRVLFRLAQHLMGDGSGISLAEGDVF